MLSSPPVQHSIRNEARGPTFGPLMQRGSSRGAERIPQSSSAAFADVSASLGRRSSSAGTRSLIGSKGEGGLDGRRSALAGAAVSPSSTLPSPKQVVSSSCKIWEQVVAAVNTGFVRGAADESIPSRS